MPIVQFDDALNETLEDEEAPLPANLRAAANIDTQIGTATQAALDLKGIGLSTSESIEDATVALAAPYIRTGGYSAIGDGGEAFFKQVESEPSHVGKWLSADSKWYEYVPPDGLCNVEALGAIGDGATNNGTLMAEIFEAFDHILLPPGDFLIDDATLAARSGMRIYGPGRLVKSVAVGGYLSDYIDVIGVEDVQILGVRFRATNSARERCIYVEDSAGVIIDSCRSGVAGDGQQPTFCVVGKNSSGVWITRNHTLGGQAGVVTGGDKTGGVDGTVDGVFIIGNYFDSPDNEMVDVNWDTRNFVIANNIATNVGHRGDGSLEAIDIGGGTGAAACRNGLVFGNIIHVGDTSGNDPGFTTPVNGLTIKGESSKIRAFGNIFFGVGQTGSAGLTYSSVNDCDVFDNEFHDFPSLASYTSTAPISNAHFRRNIGTGITAQGIGYTNGGTYTDCDNRFNEIRGDDASGIGIVTRDLTRGDISHCKISGFSTNVSIGSDCAEMTCNFVESTDSFAGSGFSIAAAGTSIIGCKALRNYSYGFDLVAADLILSNPVAVNNVVGAVSTYNIRIQAGCDNLLWTGGFIDDNRGGSATARGVQFAAAITGAIVSGFKVDGFLTAAVNGIANIGGVFKDCLFGQTTGPTTVSTDANFTLTPSSSARVQFHTGTLTADRAVTLSTTNAREGDEFEIIRKGGGAFNLNIGTGPLKALTTGTRCTVTYSSGAWVLSEYSTL